MIHGLRLGVAVACTSSRFQDSSYHSPSPSSELETAVLTVDKYKGIR